jgi:putative FmdB family regulatory protein
MPLYEYLCKKCGHRFEEIKKFSDKQPKKCPECGGVIEQVISAPAVQFKGSGWYVTDYAKKGSGSALSSGSGSATDSEGGGKDSKESSESKDTKESGSKESKESKDSKKSDKAKADSSSKKTTKKD